jgi:hypothetical protein
MTPYGRYMTMSALSTLPPITLVCLASAETVTVQPRLGTECPARSIAGTIDSEGIDQVILAPQLEPSLCGVCPPLHQFQENLRREGPAASTVFLARAWTCLIVARGSQPGQAAGHR